jgi:hypothetical protein
MSSVHKKWEVATREQVSPMTGYKSVTCGGGWYPPRAWMVYHYPTKSAAEKAVIALLASSNAHQFLMVAEKNSPDWEKLASLL